MQGENKETGVILKVKNYSASDKLITFISTTGKKHTHILKSIKSPKSRKAHAVDMGNMVEIKKKTGYAMEIVTDIKLLNEFENLKHDQQSLFFIQGICEVVDNFAYEEVENEDLYNDFVILLNSSVGNNFKFKTATFIIRHIHLSGYMQELPEYSPMVSANSDTPGIFEGVGEYSINEEEYKVMKCILERDISFTCKVRPSDSCINTLYSLSLSWYASTIGKRFNSGIFIK